ncbi:MAG TPA: TrkH family potassium uptake protein [Thermotogota bacterium]|nr:TrkH family potassium uptake protein [Thermotogota bacterium]
MSYSQILREKYQTICKRLGWLFLMFSGILLFPLFLCFFFPEEWKNSWPFLASSLLSFSTGLLLWVPFQKASKENQLTVQEGAIIVLFTWMGAIFFSALPFLFSQTLSFSHAIFESTSGWTTTGLTLVDVSRVSKLLLFWRSLTQFVGGAGFAILMVSTVGGGVSAGVYNAEGRVDNLLPNIKRSARMIIRIYLVYAVAGFLAFAVAGMGLFDALNHSLTALATGGFSTRNDSLGSFQSLPIEMVSLVLMTLGTTGFGIHYLAWKGNWKDFRRNPEPWTYLFVLAVFLPLLVFGLAGSTFSHTGQAVRHAIFQGVSALTGTGFSTVGFANWLPFPMFLLTLLMIFGGMMDSTSGGLKLLRIFVVFKAIWVEIQLFFLPKGTVKHFQVYKGAKKIPLDDALLKNILLYFTLYFLTFAVGVGWLASYGHDLKSSAFEFASALSTVGLSVGITSTSAPLSIIWVETTGMFLGRLEFIVILYAIAKLVRDLKQVRGSKKRGTF